MNSLPLNDFESRITLLLDGELPLDEVERLDAELQNDPKARELYIQCATLHSALQNHYLSCSNLPRAPIISMDRLLARHRKQLVKISLFAAAALVAVSAVSLWLIMTPRSAPSMARFLVSPGSNFTLTHKNSEETSTENNALRLGSRLQLVTGSVEAEFDSGVRCVIKAPCELIAHAKNRISMTEGVAWFKVPSNAAGFTVETPQLTIIDLGTEFGVIASDEASHEVHVFTGKVEIRTSKHHKTQENLVLEAGQARRVGAHGDFLKTALNAAHFMTSLSQDIVLRNPNFDLPSQMTDDVGYGPIAEWATSGLGIGVSSQDEPFLRQPAHSGKQVAFIQGKGTISQSVSGFSPSKLYSVTYFVNERGLPGAVTRTSVSLDLGNHSYSPKDRIVKTDAFRRIVSEPLHVFGPTANIEIKATPVAGDFALLVDSVSISRAVPAIPDGGFENPVLTKGSFLQAEGKNDGTLEDVAWIFQYGGGITTNSSQFSPPPAPEGSQAAIIQDARATLRTTVTGFEPGVTYTLSLDAAARPRDSTRFRVKLGERSLVFGNSESVTASAGRYTTFTSNEFTVADATQELIIESLTKGTTFIDDLRFNFVAEADGSAEDLEK